MPSKPQCHYERRPAPLHRRCGPLVVALAGSRRGKRRTPTLRPSLPGEHRREARSISSVALRPRASHKPASSVADLTATPASAPLWSSSRSTATVAVAKGHRRAVHAAGEHVLGRRPLEASGVPEGLHPHELHHTAAVSPWRPARA
jgi:hypothetical protein